MKKKYIQLLLFSLLIIGCQADKKEELPKNQEKKIEKIQQKKTLPTPKRAKIVEDKWYNEAYYELADMLDGKETLDFKRAVFLSEWAYMEGKLDYNSFCKDISNITNRLQKFIHEKGVSQYKTSGNYALFEYFTKKNKLNNYAPFSYDFEDFTGRKDWRKQFVTKLMDTHSGNCRSLPYLYKILAEEMNAEAYLALAPNHCYIKHLDENKKWVNIELTNGNFSTDQWMIRAMDISAEAIQNKVYMKALDLRESVANALLDMTMGYSRKYSEDFFVLRCANKVVEHHPENIHALMLKHNTLQTIGMAQVRTNGKNPPTPIMKANHKEFLLTQQRIESLGYRELSPENYEHWIKSMEEEKKKRQLTQSLSSN